MSVLGKSYYVIAGAKNVKSTVIVVLPELGILLLVIFKYALTLSHGLEILYAYTLASLKIHMYVEPFSVSLVANLLNGGGGDVHYVSEGSVGKVVVTALNALSNGAENELIALLGKLLDG